MHRARMVKLIAPILLAAASVGSAGAEEMGIDGSATVSACLLDVEQGERDLADCQGLAFRQCANLILEVRGNFGTAAAAGCYTDEVRAWLGAWAASLGRAIWRARTEGELQEAMSRYAAAQAQANETCLVRRPGELQMKAVADCMMEAYGEFLAGEVKDRLSPN